MSFRTCPDRRQIKEATTVHHQPQGDQDTYLPPASPISQHVPGGWGGCHLCLLTQALGVERHLLEQSRHHVGWEGPGGAFEALLAHWPRVGRICQDPLYTWHPGAMCLRGTPVPATPSTGGLPVSCPGHASRPSSQLNPPCLPAGFPPATQTVALCHLPMPICRPEVQIQRGRGIQQGRSTAPQGSGAHPCPSLPPGSALPVTPRKVPFSNGFT